MNIVIDTNIFISALIKEGICREILTNFKMNFLFPEFEFEEIKNHKEEIIRKTGLTEREFDVLFLRLVKYVKIIPAYFSRAYKEKAIQIISKIDPNDVQFIATALAFNCPVWSDDKHFKKQKAVRIFTTKEIIKTFKNESKAI
ncbi:MAG: PIN domain-containing protein [Candidatus Pacearchaeota archaeon]|nr:PIN domain-containing protein [Candidatus Pacearchaeota archaeon]